jgi:hypothetical protein
MVASHWESARESAVDPTRRAEEGHPMHAVLIEVDTSGQPDPEVGLKGLREQVVPGVSKAPGFQAGYWLRPRDDAKGTSLVLFDTEANAEAASEALGVGSSPMPGVTVIRREVREVAASA